MEPVTIIALIIGGVAASMAFSRFITKGEGDAAAAPTGEALFGAAMVAGGVIVVVYMVAAMLGYP